MAAAPAGLADDVDVGGPAGQAPVDSDVLAEGFAFVVLCPDLVGDGGGHLVEKLIVEAGRHSDGLGENGGRTGAGYAVKGLVPPVVGGDAQPGNGRRVVAQLTHFFFQGHLGDQFFCTGFEVHKDILSIGYSIG